MHKHGACIGARCVSTGALNSTYAATFDMDQKLGTNYHARFVSFLRHVQENDLAVAGAMMDVKGDRSKSPGGQTEPDSYLRVVEKRKDGIVVTGAKASISGAVIANEIVVLPCTALKPEEKAYAVCFAVRSDAPGVIHVAEAPGPNARRFVGDEMDYGNARYGAHGSTHVIFDNVFVPWDRVFMCGESDFAGVLVSYFALLQRLFSTACKIGHRDLLMGAAAVIADYNGVGLTRQIREKLTDLYFQSELSTGCAWHPSTRPGKAPRASSCRILSTSTSQSSRGCKPSGMATTSPPTLPAVSSAPRRPPRISGTRKSASSSTSISGDGRTSRRNTASG